MAFFFFSGNSSQDQKALQRQIHFKVISHILFTLNKHCHLHLHESFPDAGSSERLPLRTSDQQTGEPARGHERGDEDGDSHCARPDEQQAGTDGPQEQASGD